MGPALLPPHHEGVGTDPWAQISPLQRFVLCGLWTQSFINNLGTIGTAAYRFLWMAGFE